MYFRVHPSKEWIQSQIPEIVKSGVEGIRDRSGDIDEMDVETFVQAYVNIVAGACISLGMYLLLIYKVFILLGWYFPEMIMCDLDFWSPG